MNVTRKVPGTHSGIVVAGSDGGVVSGNIFVNANVGLWLTAATTRTDATGNVFRNVQSAVENQGLPKPSC